MEFLYSGSSGHLIQYASFLSDTLLNILGVNVINDIMRISVKSHVMRYGSEFVYYFM